MLPGYNLVEFSLSSSLQSWRTEEMSGAQEEMKGILFSNFKPIFWKWHDKVCLW